MTTIDPALVDTLLAQGLRERAADLGDEDRFYQHVLTTIPPAAAPLGRPLAGQVWSPDESRARRRRAGRPCSPGPPWSGRSSVSSRRRRSCLQSGPPLGG